MDETDEPKTSDEPSSKASRTESSGTDGAFPSESVDIALSPSETATGLGRKHSALLADRKGRAEAYQALGRMKEAIVEYEFLLLDTAISFGRGDRRTFVVRRWLADARRKGGQTDKAFAEYRILLFDCIESFGKDDYLTVAIREELASPDWATGGNNRDAVVSAPRGNGIAASLSRENGEASSAPPDVGVKSWRQSAVLKRVGLTWIILSQVLAFTGAFAMVTMVRHVIDVRWSSEFELVLHYWTYVRQAITSILDLPLALGRFLFGWEAQLPSIVGDWVAVEVAFLSATARLYDTLDRADPEVGAREIEQPHPGFLYYPFWPLAIILRASLLFSQSTLLYGFVGLTPLVYAGLLLGVNQLLLF